MTKSAIFAVSRNNIMGDGLSLPFDVPEDLQFFKEKTLKNTIIMGKRTFQSLKKPLPLRQNIVLTSNPTTIKSSSVTVATSLEEAFNLSIHEHIWAIGGKKLLEQSFPYLSDVWVTHVEEDVTGDVEAPLIPKYYRLAYRTSVDYSSKNDTPFYHAHYVNNKEKFLF